LARRLDVVITDPWNNNHVICQVRNDVLWRIENKKKIDLGACHLQNDVYGLSVVDPDRGSRNLLVKDSHEPTGKPVYIFRKDERSAWNFSGANTPPPRNFEQGSHSDWNPVRKGVFADLYIVFDANKGKTKASDLDEDCDVRASPLVVNMTPPGAPDRGMQLSGPTDPYLSVFFDILGWNGHPAHSKNQISWIQNPNYMFLTLPYKGKVQSIDQMFGNNTYGFDRQFAANGYAALAKYDTNRDGIIDARDKVYKHLRLWSDADRNGVSSPDELRSLDDMGVVSIDLNYDNRFYERDRYGNESRFKSVVTFKDGTDHLIFDLWFKLHD
jgi:hypothetical protein